MNWKKKSIFILSVIVCCIPLFLTFNRGINYFDEGFILEGARRMGIGELPYRDFHFIYTPLPIFLLSFMFRLFGSSIIVERILGLSISILGVIFLGLLTSKLTKNVLLTFFSMFLYALWGPTHINFLWPVMIVLPFVFIYLFLFLESHYFLAGLVAGVIFIFKHNFGAAVVISFICYFFIGGRPKKQIIAVSVGFISMMGAFLLFLVGTKSLIPFLLEIYTFTIQEGIIKKSFSVPYPTQSLFKSVLYAFPGICSCILGIGLIIQKEKRHFVIIPITFLFVYLLGIFPTPDWTHLTPLLSTTGVLIALFPLMGKRLYNGVSYLLLSIIICFGIGSLIIRNYYRWEAPLTKQTHCFSSGSMKYMCIDDKNYSIVSQTLAVMKKETATQAYIFSTYHNAIYYFLAQKKNPTSHIESPHGSKEEQKVINELKEKKVSIIITRFPMGGNPSKIVAQFIEKNYYPMHGVYEFTVWKKKN